ncbi:MAG TPA: site-specific integrase [Pseudolabrys sp.]|nr:site-specific integrase [Pseudolabrys sp.]
MQYPEIPPFKTKVIRLLEGDLFVYTEDAEGNWVDWANLYCVVELRPTSISLSTMRQRMDAVCQFHNWCAAKGIDVRARVESFEMFSVEEIAGLRKELRVNLLTRAKTPARGGRRKAKRPIVSSGQWRTRCVSIRDYVVWHADVAIQRMSPRDERLPEARRRLDHFRDKVVGEIRVRTKSPKKGLEPLAQQALLDAITPGHPTNPFAARHQQRNYALWLVYLDSGIRLGEALGLKGGDLNLHGLTPSLYVYRTPDDPEDPRVIQPNTKTLAHPVALTDRCASALHTYITRHRSKQPGAKKSPFVFFSQQGKPLSISSIAYMYRLLREKVPGLPANFSTHLLRYAWNVRFGEGAQELGLGDDATRSACNLHQGWTPHSQQGEHYQAELHRKRAQEISLRMQDKASKGSSR